MLPFEDREFPEYTIRIFREWCKEEDLQWHWDEEDRWISLLGQSDWKFQFDNHLPFYLKQGEPLFIPKGVFHRIIKGTGSFVITIRKSSK